MDEYLLDPLPLVETALVYRALPAREQTLGRPPCLVMLHGRGSDEVDLLELASYLDPRLVVISARAPYSLGVGYHWYEFLEAGYPEPETFQTSLGLLSRFVDDVVGGHGLDPDRVYVLGFSQGALMAGALALTRPERVAGAMMLSGYLPISSRLHVPRELVRGLPFFVAHGTEDPVIPIGMARSTRVYLSNLKVNLTYREYPIAHFVDEEELRDVTGWLRGRLDARGGIELASG